MSFQVGQIIETNLNPATNLPDEIWRSGQILNRIPVGFWGAGYWGIRLIGFPAPKIVREENLRDLTEPNP